jgi:Icc-related predicted phosphoesterase
MIIDCISDLHGEFPTLQGGDILIVAGDLVGHSTHEAYVYFDEWIGNQDYRFKVIIAGNHDTFIKGFEFKNCTYLEDSGCEFEGLKIWGSPRSLWFHGINPRCKAFTGSENDMRKFCERIPNDINILITHTPPYGILDYSKFGSHCGSISLLHKINQIKPIISIFGHIHEDGGKIIKGTNMSGKKGALQNKSPSHFLNIISQIKPDSNGCINWPLGKDKDGYGYYYCKRKTHIAHRLLFFILNPLEDSDKVVMHKCDNRSCCNIDHLTLGSPSENTLDMVAKNRNVKGSLVGTAKLSEEQANYIRKNSGIISVKDLCKEFKVVKQTIYNVLNNTTFVNASILNEDYEHVNKPVRIEL